MSEAIHLLRADRDYQSLVLADGAHWPRLWEFTGRPLSAEWAPVRVEHYPVGERGDFPHLASHVPVLSERAWPALEPLIGSAVEALPLLAEDDERYLALNVLSVLDCLDEERAVVEHPAGDEQMWISHYAFRPGAVGGHPIFKVRHAELKHVLASDAMRAAVAAAGLRGFVFAPLP